MKKGERVGAVMCGSDDEIKIYGFGKYLGPLPVDDGPVGMFADMAREAGIDNPCIELDNGKRVWGCECWWGSEESVRKQCEGRTVIEVDIDDVRAKYRAEQEVAEP